MFFFVCSSLAHDAETFIQKFHTLFVSPVSSRQTVYNENVVLLHTVLKTTNDCTGNNELRFIYCFTSQTCRIWLHAILVTCVTNQIHIHIYYFIIVHGVFWLDHGWWELIDSHGDKTFVCLIEYRSGKRHWILGVGNVFPPDDPIFVSYADYLFSCHMQLVFMGWPIDDSQILCN